METENWKRIKNAWITGIISGVINLLVGLVSLVTGRIILGGDHWAIIDAILIFGLSYGIYRKSRVCAVIIFVYFLAAKIGMALAGGTTSGVVLGLIFLYFYFMGIMGTFAHHKDLAEKGEKRKMGILPIIGIGVLILGLFLFAWLIIMVVSSPPAYVCSERELPATTRNVIAELGLLGPDEKIRYFYSDAFIDVKEGMYLVTNKNLIIYCKNWEAPTYIIPFDEITGLDFERDDSFWTDSYVIVTDMAGFEVSFPLSSERDGDLRFIEYLESQSENILEPTGPQDQGNEFF